ncbi:MAG: hypothetical protein ACK4GN_06310 [Runella sp.]
MRRISCLMICTLLIFGCSDLKNEAPVAQKEWLKQWETKEGFIHFMTEDDFNDVLKNESKLQQIEKQTNFQSFARANISNARLSNDDLNVPKKLAGILNQDGVIQIGKWIFKMDFDQKIVFALDEQHKLSSLKNLVEGRKSDHVYQFSFEDEVLALLEEGETGSSKNSANNGRMKLFCRGPGIGGANHQDCKNIPQNLVGAGVGVCASNQYDKYGIYFESFAVLKYLGPAQTNTFFPSLQNYDANCNWVNNCGATGGDFFVGRNFSFDTNAGIWRSKDWFYTGSRGLKELYLEVTWRYSTLTFRPDPIDKP